MGCSPWGRKESDTTGQLSTHPHSLQGLMLSVKLQSSGHLRGTADSLEKTLMLRKIGDRRRRGRQRMRRLDGITDSVDMSLGGLGSW